MKEFSRKNELEEKRMATVRVFNRTTGTRTEVSVLYEIAQVWNEGVKYEYDILYTRPGYTTR